MKNRNLILSVLLWAVCSTVFAVKLPTSPHNSFESYSTTKEVSFSLGTGTSFLNSASPIDDARAGSCYANKQDPNAMQICEDCCIGSAYIPCLDAGGSEDECGQAHLNCINSCMGRSLPLDAPTAFLLALVAAYGAVVVYRRRKVQEA